MTPRLRWILAIAGLLGGNVIAMVILAVVANNGGTQVIPAYYDKAAHYDDELTDSAWPSARDPRPAHPRRSAWRS